jgi:hypothetical protein
MAMQELEPDGRDGARHRWRFFRAGGFDQATLETGSDLLSLPELDQKLWVALSCPVAGVELDPRTLRHVDTDHDGHIRAPEVLAAVAWAGTVLRSSDPLGKRQDRLPLSAIDDRTEEGKAVLAGARHVLSLLGRPDASEIALSDVEEAEGLFAKARLNGDGVVLPPSVEEERLRAVAEAVVAATGGEPDRSGETGFSAPLVERFYAESAALSAWRLAGKAAENLPLGGGTEEGYPLYRALKGKVDDHFRRCRLSDFDPRAAALLAPSDDEYRRLSLLPLGEDPAVLAHLPLAVPAAGKELPLSAGLNPSFLGDVERFAAAVVRPLLGDRPSLSEEGWEKVKGLFAPREAWEATRPATCVEGVDPALVDFAAAGAGKEELLAHCARDLEVAPEVEAITAVERLLLFARDLHSLVNNFVSFRDFYTRKGKASFQAGTLFIDGRSCDLCIPVTDVTRHAAVATLGRTCLLYCDCVRPGSAEKMTIAAAVTAGDSDQLMVGRNGVFYDRKGRDWDATIVRILEHPISIRQAFWAPFKKAARMMGEQFQKVAAARAKASEDRLGAQAAAAGGAAAEGKAPAAPPAPFDVARFAGIFAAIGLAVGAIGTALAAVVTGFLKLAWWQIPLALAGIVLAISGPSMLLAWFKLRTRNLGPILDANGWAVNARARINIPFGTSLTAVAKLPENAERSLSDPFAEKKSPWPLYLLLVALAGAAAFLWSRGILQGWIGWK